MTTKPTTNPYQPPKASDQPSVPGSGRKHWFSGWLAGNVFVLCFNLLILFVANTLLHNLLVEFGADIQGELPTISQLAYSIAAHWLATGMTLMCFAAVAIYGKAKLDAQNRRRGFIYATLVTVIWFLFTAGFIYAISHPLKFMGYSLQS